MKTLWRWTRRALLALVLAFVAYQLWLLGHVLWWKWMPPSETSFMSLRLSELNEKTRYRTALSLGSLQANLRYTSSGQ